MIFTFDGKCCNQINLDEGIYGNVTQFFHEILNTANSIIIFHLLLLEKKRKKVIPYFCKNSKIAFPET